jgi:hypothetical protein
MVEIAIVWDLMLFDVVKFTDVSNHIYGSIGMQLTNSDSPRARTSPI